MIDELRTEAATYVYTGFRIYSIGYEMVNINRDSNIQKSISTEGNTYSWNQVYCPQLPITLGKPSIIPHNECISHLLGRRIVKFPYARLHFTKIWTEAIEVF
jgi:hypothetical protein